MYAHYLHIDLETFTMTYPSGGDSTYQFGANDVARNSDRWPDVA